MTMAEPTITVPIDESVTTECTQPGADGVADVLITTMAGFELALTGKASDLLALAEQITHQMGEDEPDGGWTTEDVACLPAPCWVENPTTGVWFCTRVGDPVEPGNVRGLTLIRRGDHAVWFVKDGTAVRYAQDNHRPPITQPTLDEARDVAEVYELAHAGNGPTGGAA